MRNQTLFWAFLILALLLHVPFALIHLSKNSTPNTAAGSESRPIEIDFQDRRAVVQTEKSEIENDKKADQVGEFRNRVEEETLSPYSGKFNSAKLFPTVKEMVQEALTEPLVIPRNPYALNGIKRGNTNSLNTDEVSYASYLNRIGNEIYDRWAFLARQAFENQKDKIAEKTYVTKLKLTLDEKGEVMDIETMKSSGVGAFDEATQAPFWETGYFPNPPKSIFDGRLATVTFEFHFEVEKSFLKIFSL